MASTSAVSALLLCLAVGGGANRLLLVREANETALAELFKASLPSGVAVAAEMAVDHEADSDEAPLCDALSGAGAEGVAAVVDLSWGGWAAGRKAAQDVGVPYVHVEASNKPFVMGMDAFLYARDAIDAALLFETETELDQSLYHIIGNYHLRVLVLSRAEKDPFSRMEKLRPIPSAFVAFGTTAELTDTLKKAQDRKMIRRDSRWNFVVEDFDGDNFATSGTGDVDVVIVSMKPQVCCGLTGQSSSNPSSCLSQCQTKPKQLIVKKAASAIGAAVASLTPESYSCSQSAEGNSTAASFLSAVRAGLSGSGYTLGGATTSLSYPVELTFKLANKTSGRLEEMGTWTADGGVSFEAAFVGSKIPRFFRVGMAPAVPWLYEKKDKHGGAVRDKDGNIVYEGYCMDLLNMIAKKLNFNYEVVVTNETRPGYTYGRKLEDGEWTGMIGDLADGETDLIVADLTMTSEREEVIDFVSPYFDQAGISIVLRKKLREQSLFKFLSVLKTEVWLGIVAAVVVTAILIWLLDRYSPYSARNNKAAYPYPCRDFTLKESFWFALTSLTPQGGGEAPKALSGRVLVAAYWLFVVLMLATFTANLAAFLTVERMQTTVQSLEELARQSRINYTVVQDTSYMEYFVNMAGAEEELYHKWKELTLNSSGNPAKYRVWDYPIREQYTHILKVIEETGPVSNTKDGFDNVLKHVDGDYAFIHDAARIRYEVYNNCNLTEVGEPFAEQPYALAVQQGSHLQEELSRVILELQKDRYFESLQSHYWNSSTRNDCPILDDSDGITLQSLGGVFIATLIGLALALLTLAVEVVLQKRKEGAASNKVESIGGGGRGDLKETRTVSGGMDPALHKRGMPAVIGH